MLALQEFETFSLYKREFKQIRREHAAVGDVPIRFLASDVRMLNERLLEAPYVPVERPFSADLSSSATSTQSPMGQPR